MWHISWLNEVDSTNSWLRSRAEAFSAVVAKSQTSGRGRQGRDWIGGDGNLFMSACLPKLGDGDVLGIALVSAVAAYESVCKHIDGCYIKFPNDIEVGGKKMAGLLSEVAGDNVVVGLGVNVAVAPVVADRESVSLNAVVSVADLVDDFLDHLYFEYQSYVDVSEYFSRHCDKFRPDVSFNTAKGKQSGVLKGFTRDAALIKQGGAVLSIPVLDILY